MAASVAVNVEEDSAPSDGFIFLRGKPVRFKKGLPVLDEECLRYTRSYNRTSAVAPFIMHGIGLAMAFDRALGRRQGGDGDQALGKP